MSRQVDLQVKIRERYRHLMTAPFTSYEHEVRLVLQFLDTTPAIVSVLAQARAQSTGVSVEQWLNDCNESRGLQWPTESNADRADLLYRFLQQLADPSANMSAYSIGFSMLSERNAQDAARSVTEKVIQPLFDYLGEQIGEDSNILYSLSRYVRQVEWFDRERLNEAYLANTQQGEAVYDRHLREFLFREGIDMPFSQAQGPSGTSDVIAELHSEDPLVCEVKIYDGASHPRRNVGGGLNQVLQYAQDHAKHVGHLVIINRSESALNLPTESTTGERPGYITVDGIRVYLVSVRALPMPSASKRGKAAVVAITLDDLTNPDA